MTKKISLWVLFFVFLSFFPSQASALVCYSPKKGAVNHQYYIESSKLGITNLYAYGLEDITPDEAPMLAKDHINRLMANQNPDICNLTTNCNNPNHCCPAKRIREIVQTWGKGRYWLIFNEPMGIDPFNDATAAAEHAAFAMSFVKKYDDGAKFIVGWFAHQYSNGIYESIYSKWPTVINAHHNHNEYLNLSTEMNDEIAGWHIHPYGLRVENVQSLIIDHPVRRLSPGKELWLTEFNTTGLDPDPARNPCQYTNIDTTFGQTGCLPNAIAILNWLENTDYVNRYFWYSGQPCKNPGAPTAQLFPSCFSPLVKLDCTLNSLGETFAAIPNDNGVCRECPPEHIAQTASQSAIITYCSNPENIGHGYAACPTGAGYVSPLTCHSGSSAEFVPFGPDCTPAYCECQCNSLPSPTPTPSVIPGDVNGDGQVNMADYSLFVANYGTVNPACDFNKNGSVDMGDYSLLATYYGL